LSGAHTLGRSRPERSGWGKPETKYTVCSYLLYVRCKAGTSVILFCRKSVLSMICSIQCVLIKDCIAFIFFAIKGTLQFLNALVHCARTAPRIVFNLSGMLLCNLYVPANWLSSVHHVLSLRLLNSLTGFIDKSSPDH